MATPRNRNDTTPTVYRVENTLIGERGEWHLTQWEMMRLSLMIRQADRLFSVKILSFQVTETGYSLICSAPAERPSADDLRLAFIKRYGNRRTMPDFDDPDIYERWASRMRDFSCLIKHIQQRFTQWYNRVIRAGRRKGTIWKSRFQSTIVKTARQLLRDVKKSLGRKPAYLRKVQGKKWRKARQGFSFVCDVTAPILSVAGSSVMLVICVLLDELGQLPQSPFPLKYFRNYINRRMRNSF